MKIERWLRNLKSRDRGTQLRAAEELGKIREASAADALAEAAIADISDLHEAALAGLKNLGPELAVPAILNAAAKSPPQDWFQIGMLEDFIKVFGAAAIAPLETAIASGSQDVQYFAGGLLLVVRPGKPP